VTRLVVESVIDSVLHGGTRVPLYLTYRVADPAAISLSFLSAGGPRRWSVARDALRNGLDVDRVMSYAGEAAAAVQLSTQPGYWYALLILRSPDRVRWPLTVPVAPLSGFIDATYTACPPEREARIVADELAAQCGFLTMTQGGAA
jgi:hypothetical protein